MMLRQSALFRLARRSTPDLARCSFAATSQQKRAIKKSQLEGSQPDPPAASPASPPPGSGAAAAAKSPLPSGADSSSFLPMAAVGAVVAAGGIYYYYYSTMDQTSRAAVKTSAPDEAPPAKVESKPAVVPKQKKETGAKKQAKEETKKEQAPSGNRVTKIDLPSGSRPRAAVATSAEHPPKGSRVLMQAPSNISAAEAAKELKKSAQEEASATVKEAHAALRANLDESLFSDLDKLSEAQLRVRVVQLAADMQERTKWEAVRLKEFLALKEKETADKYMELMQKQRLDLEAQVSRRLREQEDILSRQAQAAIQQKEEETQEVVEAAAAAQQAEHEADLASAKERMEAELTTKYETDYAQKLADEKTKFADELEAKVGIVEELSSKLGQLEAALKESKAFEAGSLQAHRLSAAALALAEKLETSQGAATEVEALSAAAKDNTVIETALAAVPESIATGIPTLPELQAKFEVVYKKCRQAAMVPEGRKGLDGQIIGMVFSKLKYSPDPDEPAPEDAQDDAEYILARARRHVQLGELERAVEQLDKLQGQAAFTVKDWKKKASDRVAVNKTLRAIKLESALMNESLGAAPAVAE